MFQAEGRPCADWSRLGIGAVLGAWAIWITEAGALEAGSYMGARLWKTVNATLGVLIPFYKKLESLEGLTKSIWRKATEIAQAQMDSAKWPGVLQTQLFSKWLISWLNFIVFQRIVYFIPLATTLQIMDAASRVQVYLAPDSVHSRTTVSVAKNNSGCPRLSCSRPRRKVVLIPHF